MPEIIETIEINCTPADIFPVISDFEKYPDIMEDVERTTILERGEGYELVEFVAKVDGRKFSWVEKNIYKPAENRIDFTMVKGNIKNMGGYWQLENAGSSTKIEYCIHFDIGIPMISAMIHPLLARKLRDNMKQALTDVKKKVESQ